MPITEKFGYINFKSTSFALNMTLQNNCCLTSSFMHYTVASQIPTVDILKMTFFMTFFVSDYDPSLSLTSLES